MEGRSKGPLLLLPASFQCCQEAVLSEFAMGPFLWIEIIAFLTDRPVLTLLLARVHQLFLQYTKGTALTSLQHRKVTMLSADIFALPSLILKQT